MTDHEHLQEPTRHALRDHIFHLPLRSFTPPQLVAIDVVLVLIAFAIAQWVPPLRATKYDGTLAHVTVYALLFAVSVIFLFRRRYPKATLGLLLILLVTGECLRSPATASNYLLFAVYSVVVTSSRRTGISMSAIALLTTVAGVIVSGDNLISVAVASLAGNILVGWLTAEYVRSARSFTAMGRHSSPVSQPDERPTLVPELQDLK